MKQALPWTLVVLLAMALLWSFRASRSGSAQSAQAKADAKSVYEKGWAVYDGDELLKKRKDSGRAYLPFLRVPTLNCGIYALPAKGKDGQSPHKEDEVYYVMSGSGKFEAGSGKEKRTTEFKKGAVIYVKAGVEHRFVEISEDIELLVFFSTAKGS